MKRGERLRERRRNIRAHVEALLEAKARDEAVLQRRAATRVVGGTDYAWVDTATGYESKTEARHADRIARQEEKQAHPDGGGSAA